MTVLKADSCVKRKATSEPERNFEDDLELDTNSVGSITLGDEDTPRSTITTVTFDPNLLDTFDKMTTASQSSSKKPASAVKKSTCLWVHEDATIRVYTFKHHDNEDQYSIEAVLPHGVDETTVEFDIVNDGKEICMTYAAPMLLFEDERLQGLVRSQCQEHCLQGSKYEL